MKDFPSYDTNVFVLQNRMDVSQILAWMEVYAEATGGTTCVCVKRVMLETAARHVCKPLLNITPEKVHKT